jgi:drug/metabolite transporter (DMT)-like permease
MTESIPIYFGVTARFVIAGVLLFAYLAITNRASLRVTRRQLASTALYGLSFIGWSMGILAVAIHYVPSGQAALLVSVLPVWIVLLRLFTGDRPSWKTLLGVVVGLLGLVWILLPGGTDSHSGTDAEVLWWSLVIVVSSITWAVTSWFSPRLDKPKSDLAAVAYQSFFGAVVLLLIGLFRGERWDFAATTTSSWVSLLFLGIVGSILGWYAFVWLLQNSRLSLMSTYAYVNPVVAVIVGLVLGGEMLSSDIIVGCTVVLAGVVLVVSGEQIGAPKRLLPREHST